MPESGDIPGHDLLAFLIAQTRAHPALNGQVGVFDRFQKKIGIAVTHAQGHHKNLGNPENSQDLEQREMPGGKAKERGEGYRGYYPGNE